MISNSGEEYVVVKRTLHSGAVRFVVMQRDMLAGLHPENPSYFYTEIKVFFEEWSAVEHKRSLMSTTIAYEEVIG